MRGPALSQLSIPKLRAVGAWVLAFAGKTTRNGSFVVLADRPAGPASSHKYLRLLSSFCVSWTDPPAGACLDCGVTEQGPGEVGAVSLEAVIDEGLRRGAAGRKVVSATYRDSRRLGRGGGGQLQRALVADRPPASSRHDADGSVAADPARS